METSHQHHAHILKSRNVRILTVDGLQAGHCHMRGICKHAPIYMAFVTLTNGPSGHSNRVLGGRGGQLHVSLHEY